MSALSRWVTRRRDLAIDEYRLAAHALAVARHGVNSTAIREAEERIRVATARLERWERISFVVHGNGSRA